MVSREGTPRIDPAFEGPRVIRQREDGPSYALLFLAIQRESGILAEIMKVSGDASGCDGDQLVHNVSDLCGRAVSVQRSIDEEVLFHRDISLGLVEWFAGEVVERVSEEREHEDADPVVVERVVFVEAGDGPVGGGFVELHGDSEEANDATGGD